MIIERLRVIAQSTVSLADNAKNLGFFSAAASRPPRQQCVIVLLDCLSKGFPRPFKTKALCVLKIPFSLNIFASRADAARIVSILSS